MSLVQLLVMYLVLDTGEPATIDSIVPNCGHHFFRYLSAAD